jgi:hypothetical protein
MRLFRNIARNVIVLGWVSFFTDLASEMLYPVIPLFLTGTLGLSKDALGLIEGIAEGISTGLRWIGGVLSDWARRRKPFVFCGYGLSALSKPIMGLAAIFGGWPVFLAGRSADRLGKSIRTAARDALIADATEPEHRGLAFGFHRAMDTAGAVLGPLTALVILWLRPETPLAYLFFIALAPGLVSTLFVGLFVKDSPHEPDFAGARARFRWFQAYPAAFWRLILANAIFSLGNSSDSLIILRATELWTGRQQVQAATFYGKMFFLRPGSMHPLMSFMHCWRRPRDICPTNLPARPSSVGGGCFTRRCTRDLLLAVRRGCPGRSLEFTVSTRRSPKA